MAQGRSRIGGPTWIPEIEKAMLDRMLPLLADLVPEDTACEATGIDKGAWRIARDRLPALRMAVEKVRAEKKVQLQRIVEAGAQGWQAAATLLERLDADHFSRSVAAQRAGGSPLGEATASARAGRARKLKVLEGGRKAG